MVLFNRLSKPNKIPFIDILYFIWLQWRDWGYFHCWSLCGSGHGNFVLLSSKFETCIITIFPLLFHFEDLFIKLIIFCILNRAKLRQELHAGLSVLQNITRLGFWVFTASSFCLYIVDIINFVNSCLSYTIWFRTWTKYVGHHSYLRFYFLLCVALAYWRGAWLRSSLCWSKLP